MKRAAPAAGFTYLGLLILLAVLGLVGAAGLKMGTLLQRAAAEEELLEIGAQFQDALRSYAAATPPGQKQQPATLQDLLKDPRFPNPRRHLRKIFVDPVTGKAEWGIIYLGDPIAVNAGNSVNALGGAPAPAPASAAAPMSSGEKVGVIGVYSLSDAPPLKIANFDIRFQNMENRQKISEWKFVLTGGEGGNPPVNTPANSMVGDAPPPSLFPQPGIGAKPAEAVAGAGMPGGKGATPPNPGQGIKPAEPPPPPVPEEPEPAAQEPAKAEEAEPVPSDEEKAAEEKEPEQEDTATTSDTKAAPPQGTVAPPPPEIRGGRRR